VILVGEVSRYYWVVKSRDSNAYYRKQTRSCIAAFDGEAQSADNAFVATV